METNHFAFSLNLSTQETDYCSESCSIFSLLKVFTLKREQCFKLIYKAKVMLMHLPLKSVRCKKSEFIKVLTDVKFVSQPNAWVAIMNIKAYHITNLQFRMDGFLLTMQNSSYDRISFRKKIHFNLDHIKLVIDFLIQCVSWHNALTSTVTTLTKVLPRQVHITLCSLLRTPIKIFPG